MDAALALIFVVSLIIMSVVLYLTLWCGSIALIYSPKLVADRVVHRFWPERLIDSAALIRYRFTGFIGLVLAVAITWIVLLEFLP